MAAPVQNPPAPVPEPVPVRPLAGLLPNPAWSPPHDAPNGDPVFGANSVRNPGGGGAFARYGSPPGYPPKSSLVVLIKKKKLQKQIDNNTK